MLAYLLPVCLAATLYHHSFAWPQTFAVDLVRRFMRDISRFSIQEGRKINVLQMT